MATHYVAQLPLGLGDGSDADNARGMSWLNNRDNWNGGLGTILPSSTKDTVQDVIRFVGTITTAFSWPYATSTGLAGIKFAFDPGAKFSAATWTAGAMYWESGLYQKHRVTIDGEGVGIIECTDNGSSLTYQLGSLGIYAISASYLTIKNLTIRNLYVRDDLRDQVDGGSGIYCATTGGAYTDLLIENCTIHDVNIAINTPYTDNSARYTYRDNELYNVNWGIGCGSSTLTSTMTGFVAEGNWIHDFDCWGSPILPSGLPEEGYEAFHHNCIFLWGSNGTNMFADALIQRNKFGPNLGTRATSCVYLSSYGMRGEYRLYNNLFLGSASNGLLNIGTGTSSIVRAYNNTFIGGSTGTQLIAIGGGSATSNLRVYLRNNVCETGLFISGNNVGSVVMDTDYNLVHDFPTGFPGVISWSTGSSGSAMPWATWQGLGNDVNSLYNQDPLIDSNGRPGTGSPAITAGADMSAYFTDTYDEVVRVAPWDMGAYEGVGTATAPAITLHPVSQTVTSGATVSLSCNASGFPAPTFQWRQGGDTLSGETSRFLTLTAVTTGGVYDCVATNSEGSATTDAAIITVLAPVGTSTINPLGHRGTCVCGVGAF